MKITNCFSTNHTTKLKRDLIYIVIHYTAGTNSKKGKALEIAKMFATSNREASADFIVDDETIVQYNPDPKEYYCYAVGGAKYPNPCSNLGGRLHGIATNKNCVNIELCSSKKNTKSLNATDEDWYFTDKVIQNGLELVRYLMELYNIPIDNVIMHHEVTGKICPNPFCINSDAIGQWKLFKIAITEKLKYKNKKYTFIGSSNLRTTMMLGKEYKVKYKTLSLAMKRQCVKDENGYAVVKVGGRITIVDVIKSNGNYWGKTKSGHYVLIEYNDKTRVE